MTGPEFAKLTPTELDNILPNLQGLLKDDVLKADRSHLHFASPC